MKGSYVLIIKVLRNKEIKIGKLGNIYFKRGFYAYVGSAMNGLEKRIERHLKLEKKMKWHIDYLLMHAIIRDVFYKESDEKEECKIANYLIKKFEYVNKFGSSDCNCKSHLFFGKYNKFVEELLKLRMKRLKNFFNFQ